MAGFTLLELLVVLVIFSMIVVALTSGIRLAGRAWSMQERMIDRQDDVGAVQRQLRLLIAGGRHFKGDPGSLSFVAALPAALDRPGLFDIELTTSGDRLILDWTRHVPPDPASAGVPPDKAETDLMKRVSRLDLSYYYGPAPCKPGEWHERVGDKSPPPALVGIAIELPEQGGRHWPPLAIAPRIEPSRIAMP